MKSVPLAMILAIIYSCVGFRLLHLGGHKAPRQW